uniref:Integrase catalytic domain-containing protein n=1 Tax=Fagus sylvatica TaxID=28930 RepID=A0A2N9IPG8_FAGSY
MTGEEGKVSGIEKFDGTDFGYWRMQIEDYLYGKKLHLPLLGEKLEDMEDAEWTLLDRQVLGVIRLTLSRTVAHNVVKEKTTAELMTALCGMYEKPSANNKVHLMKKLFNLKMAEGTAVAQHLNEFNTITNQLSSVEIEFDDEIRALIVLASLPNSWEAMRMAVSNSAGKGKLKYNDIRDLILGEEVRRRDAGETSSSGSALNLEARGRGKDRNYNRGRSKSRKGRSKSKPGRQLECWNCGKTGHIRKNCWELKKKNENDSANVVTEEVHDALLLSVDSPIESWVLDSGASFHTTAHQEIIQNYVAGDFGKVYLADDEALDVVGMGDVRITLPNGSVWLLQKVRHVPELKRNLISVGQLDTEGHAILFMGGTWKITKGAMVVARGKKTGTLYMTTSPRDTIAVAEAGTDTNLWHRRLGHMSEKGMKVLLSKGKLPNLKSVEFDMCESCILGKQKKVSFLKGGRTPKSKKLELVHTDLWGPSPIASLGGSRYYVTFIDDSSRKVWVYFLKNKSEVFETFKKWRAMVETETDLKLKCLRSDNGGEYINGGFKEFCAANGIRMEKTIPRTPQQNGVAERMNRTLNERARSMRLHAGLPETFWADAVNTAAYLINRGPSVPLEFRIPEEVWSGKEVNLSYLKVFGCVSYVHIDSDARSKLDAKSRKCFFIGYGDETFGYRFWDDQNRKVIRSRNVIFNEQVMYKDRSSTKLDDVKVEQKKSEFVNLDEFSNNTMQNSGQEEKENANPQVEQCTPAITVCRSSRNIRPPQRFSPSLFYILLTDGGEPESYDEALQIEDSIKWELAMKDEMNSLMTSQTWELTELPQRKKALHNKWVYRVKEEHDGSKRYKARLVVKGFQQKEGVDYTDIFSPVVKLTTIRLVLGIVATENLHLEQLDVKTAFLHGDLEEDIYMSQPQGFIVQGKENLVCKLRKSLYGLKQAPRQWYKKFDSFMYSTGFTRNNLSKQFAMKDLGPAKQILGMRIIRDRANGTLKLSQTEYVKKILSRFSMDEAKPVSTPLGSHFRLTKDQSPKTEQEQAYMSKVPYASAIGSLMYAMVCTRPDIAHAVGVVSRYMSNPGKQHWEAVKWILRYLKGTLGTSLCFTGADMKLTGYVDSDLAGDVDTRKSTTGYVYTLGGIAVSWVSRLQKIVALSTTEAEYVAVTEAGKEMVWLQGFLEELGQRQKKGILHSDSQSAIFLAKNPGISFQNKAHTIEISFYSFSA